jgi:hypothetical protein
MLITCQRKSRRERIPLVGSQRIYGSVDKEEKEKKKK